MSDLAARDAAYRKKHKRQIAARSAAYYKKHKRQIAVYRKKHKRKLAAYNAAWHKKHKRQIAARKAAYRKKHKRQIAARSAAYRKKHKRQIVVYRKTPNGRAIYRAHSRKRRVLKYRLPYVEHVTPMPADGRCPHCRVMMTGTWPAPNSPSLDHIIPLARGGHHVPNNTQMICLSCNTRKRDKLPNEWGSRLD